MQTQGIWALLLSISPIRYKRSLTIVMRSFSFQFYAIVIVLIAQIRLPPAWSKHNLTSLARGRQPRNTWQTLLWRYIFCGKTLPAVPMWHQPCLMIGLNLGVRCWSLPWPLYEYILSARQSWRRRGIQEKLWSLNKYLVSNEFCQSNSAVQPFVSHAFFSFYLVKDENMKKPRDMRRCYQRIGSTKQQFEEWAKCGHHFIDWVRKAEIDEENKQLKQTFDKLIAKYIWKK